ncbi:MAG: hypothetical protein JSU59_02680 [Nitrospirota bacterium]|nr:MAG: hypothetical protein JSU59_02680 [Nitrospirota bacterium]
MQKSFKPLFIGLISFTLVGTVGVTPVFSISIKERTSIGGIKPIIEKLFPPCGPGTRGKRFVVSPKHPGEVCDNNTGLYWQ